MATIAFKLGDIAFDVFEVPEEFEDGLETAFDKKDHPGGGRTITTFGVHELPVSWSGWFWGADARDKLDALKRLQALCQPVTWTYGEESWQVVIVRVKGGRKNQNKIRYAIDVEILENKSHLTAHRPPDTDTSILRGLNTATKVVNAPGTKIFPDLAAANLFNAFAATMDAAFPWTGLTYAAAQRLIAQALGVERAFDLLLQPLRAKVQTAEQMDALVAGEDALAGVRTSRINLALYFAGMAGGALVANTNLWQQAVMQYGDATQALEVMDANGLTDVDVAAPVALSFPPAPPGSFDIAIISNGSGT